MGGALGDVSGTLQDQTSVWAGYAPAISIRDSICMTALRLANRLLGLLSASALLVCGALAAAGAPWVPRLGWIAAVCFTVAMWEGR